MSLVMKKGQFLLLRGEMKQFTRASDSGGQVVCSFCPDCGTRIIHDPTRMAGMVNVRAGTLDDTGWLSPAVQAWTSSKQPWIHLDDAGLRSFQRQP